MVHDSGRGFFRSAGKGEREIALADRLVAVPNGSLVNAARHHPPPEQSDGRKKDAPGNPDGPEEREDLLRPCRVNRRRQLIVLTS